jgi:tripartite-type tricarboxylate transporter receptor subunit TctC
VPFAGGGPLTQSVLGGHTPIACSAIGNYMTMIREGKLRALAVASAQRVELAPNIPTLNEIGLKGQEAETMTGVFVPAGTPKEVVALLQKEIAAIVNAPNIKPRLLELGTLPEGDTSEHFAAYVKDEIVKWKRVIETGKIPKI